DAALLGAIGSLWVRARNGELIDLRNVVKVEKGATAASITRTDRQRSVKVMGSLDGISLDVAVARAQGQVRGFPGREKRGGGGRAPRGDREGDLAAAPAAAARRRRRGDEGGEP